MEESRWITVEPHSPTGMAGLADFAAIGYRWRNRMMIVFVVTLIGGFISAFHFREYESEMKILLKKDRVRLPPPEQSGFEVRQDLGEEELNTEVELLRSEDVLRNVVREVRLQEKTAEPLWVRVFGTQTGRSEEIREEKAVRGLSNRLAVILPKKSSMITVRYRSGDPRLAVAVLTALSRLYVEKHMAVRRQPEQFRFFATEAEQYRAKLAEAEVRLTKFPQVAGTAAAARELELTESRLGEIRLEYNQTQAAVEEVRKRMASLQVQLASASPRMTTVVRRTDNQYLMSQLKTTLLSLELKHTELLKKFEPTYREVQEIDRDIAQTRAAIDSAERAPTRDETTDRDPTYEWMRSELAKARADLNAQLARAASLEASILEYEQEARRLNEKSLEQQALLREAKTLEEAYQLYARKSEEARIDDALDQSRILSLSIAQTPTVPLLPRRSPWTFILGGFVLALVLSAATGFASERLDDSFRTPAELAWNLKLPVLAVLPSGETEQMENGGTHKFSNEQAFRSI
jgi:uncharacterized protein involved in exopolysaccharide biosynthesis